MPTLILTRDELENLAVCVSFCVDSQEEAAVKIVDAKELPALKRLSARLEKKCSL